MAVNSDEVTIQGIYDVQNLPTRLRKFAKDKDVFRFWVFRQLTTVTLLRVIAEKFGSVPSGDVADWVFKYNEFDELDYMFSLSEDSNTTDSSNTKFKVTTAVANIIGLETRLLIDGIYCKKAITDFDTDTATARNLSTGIVDNEVCRVLKKGDDDGTHTIVTVKRGHPADSPSNTPKAVTTSMTLTVVNLVARSNSGYLPIVNKNSKQLENVIEITRRSYGVGELLTKGGGIETYLSDGQEFLNNSYRLAEIFVTKTMERAILEGRKSIKEVAEGNMELETGGVFEFIPVSNYINWGGLEVNIPNLNGMIREVADAAGVQELWWFTGTKLAQQIANAYEDKRSFYTTNPTLTGKYMVRVREIESTGRALTIFHVVAPVMNELGKANEGVILNLTEYNWNKKHKFGCFQVAYKTGEGFQDLPKDAESYERGSGYQGVIRELYTTWGLVRRLAETHFYTYGFPDVVDMLAA